MLKNAFAVFLIATLCYHSAPLAAALPTYPFIHASGTASLNVLPDVGEIDFEVVVADRDGAAAWQAAEQQVLQIRALLAEKFAGAAVVDVQNLSRSTRKQDSKNPDAIPLVEARCAIHITVGKLQQWTPLVTTLLAMPHVEGFATAFSRSDRQQIESELVGHAIADAKRRAEDIARGFGRRAGAVNAVSTGPLKNVSNALGLATAESYRPLVRPNPEERDYSLVGVLKMVQSVDVIFRIK